MRFFDFPLNDHLFFYRVALCVGELSSERGKISIKARAVTLEMRPALYFSLLWTQAQ